MKQFFKFVFASFVGILLFGMVTLFFGVFTIIGMIALSQPTTQLEDNSILVLNLSGQLSERAESNVIDQLQGQTGNSIGLDKLLKGIRKAKNNDHIKGIYIEAGAFIPDSYASIQAIRNALDDFKKSKKWIVAYGDIYTQGTYYLASIADKVYLNPQGQIDWHGLSAQRMYLKDLLGKFGVKMQVAKVGTYKSATEQFTGNKMSDADRAQTTAYLNSIWSTITKEVSKSRGVSVAQLNQFADSLITFSAPADYVKMKMVDKLLYTDQVKKEIKKLLNLRKSDDIHQASLEDMENTDDNESEEAEAVAVYYAYGDIVDGAASGLFVRGNNIDAQTVCKDLEELTNNDDIKAVVIRINSGGGSAYASEQIWHQIMELKKEKPVVISMGGMAASGGYYISAPANWIVAEPTTLTGSIGIFGMFPDTSGLLNDKLGVRFDEVNTNRNSSFGTQARPFNAEEMQYLERYVDRGYKLFRHRVAEGRKMSDEQVELLAQGHVYTGADAQKLKLVDQLGGVNTAIAKAVQLAKIDHYYIVDYPEQKDWLEQFLEETKGGSYLDEQLRTGLGAFYEPFSLLKNINHQSAIQARLPYYLTIN